MSIAAMSDARLVGREPERDADAWLQVILPGPAEEELWLTGELDDALELLRPIDASRVAYQAANPALNKVGEAPEGPKLLVAPAAHT